MEGLIFVFILLLIAVSALVIYNIVKNAVKEGTLEALMEYERIKREENKDK